MSGKMTAPNSGIKIRMYRHGFGDCFLLGFKSKDGNPKYMLIDCGLHHRFPDARKLIQETIEDISSACGGHLHVLAVSHEHTDHISGFQHAYDLFSQKIQVDRVWLSWAEDETNDTTKILKDKYAKDKEAVSLAYKYFKSEIPSFAEAILGLPTFDDLLSAAGDKNTQEAMKFIKGLAPVEYCYPGEKPKTLEGVEGIRVLTLGPPESLEMIRMDEKAGEMYLRGLWIDQDTAFRAEVVGRSRNLSAEENIVRERNQPFKPSYRRSADDPMLSQLMSSYYAARGQEWRNIDHTWLEEAGELALKLESHRNNTSLVLAIEIESSGKVLLFPGDAQAGSWMSWGEVEWEIGDEKFKGEDLLKRTVLYKVGHHGSHNATLRGKGLELMNSPDFVAMIPVDEAFAAQQGRRGSDGKPKGWKMPYHNLLVALNKRTRGRVLQADKKIPPQSATALNAQEWLAFEKATDGSGNKFIEFMVGG